MPLIAEMLEAGGTLCQDDTIHCIYHTRYTKPSASTTPLI
jgi:hypothetical protein